MADPDEIILLLHSIAEIFERELSPNVLQLYVRALEDLRIDVVFGGACWLLGESEYFPRPAELRNAAMDWAAANLPALPPPIRPPPPPEPEIVQVTAAEREAVFAKYGWHRVGDRFVPPFVASNLWVPNPPGPAFVEDSPRSAHHGSND